VYGRSGVGGGDIDYLEEAFKHFPTHQRFQLDMHTEEKLMTHSSEGPSPDFKPNFLTDHLTFISIGIMPLTWG
jgi:hypothetical protein